MRTTTLGLLLSLSGAACGSSSASPQAPATDAGQGSDPITDAGQGEVHYTAPPEAGGDQPPPFIVPDGGEPLPGDSASGVATPDAGDAGGAEPQGSSKTPQVIMCPPPTTADTVHPDLAGGPVCIPWKPPPSAGGLTPPPMIVPDAGPSPAIRPDFRPEITCGTEGQYNTVTTTEPYPYVGINYDSSEWNNNMENVDAVGFIRAQGTFAFGTNAGLYIPGPNGANPPVPSGYDGPWWGTAFVGFMVSPVAPCVNAPSSGVELTTVYVATLSVNLNLEYNHQTFGVNGALSLQCEESYGNIEVTVYDVTQGTPQYGWVMLDTTREIWADQVCGVGQNLQNATTTPVPYNISGSYTNFVATLGHTYQVFVQAATSTTDYYDQFSACMEGGPIGSTPPCLNVDWLQAQVVDVSIESTPMQAVAVPVGPTSSN